MVRSIRLEFEGALRHGMIRDEAEIAERFRKMVFLGENLTDPIFKFG